jgi:hypothetical protein
VIERTLLREKAARHLQRIGGREPLYRPAVFTLAYLRLQEGDTEEAGRLFSALTEPYRREADLRLTEAKEKWRFTGLKYRFVFRIDLIRQILRPWGRLQLHILRLLEGGELYRAAEDWEKFGARAISTEKIPSINAYIETFPKIGDIQNHARIAAGIEAGDRARARAALDSFLSKEKLKAFDWQLSVLETTLVSARADSSFRDALLAHRDDSAAEKWKPKQPNLEPLKAGRFVEYYTWFKPTLDELSEYWQREEWSRCERLLRDLRDLTRAPDDDEASSLLKQGSFPETESGAGLLRRFRHWLAKIHFPAFTLPDSWRNTFRNGFFLESEYYLALCRYRNFTSSGARKAMMQAKELHTRVLAGAVPNGIDLRRYAELRVLAQCLEIDAVVRLRLADKQDPVPKDVEYDAISRWFVLQREVVPTLRQLVNDRSHSPRIRATVLRSLGLIERCERRKSQTRNNAEKLIRELDRYRHALNFERSADTCFYLAETLLEDGRSAEAKMYLEEVVRLCPRHAGGLRLQGSPEPHSYIATTGEADGR